MTIKKIEPDGYCAWHPSSGYEVEYGFGDTENSAREKLEFDVVGYGLGWQIKPVYLVSPELLGWVEKVRMVLKNQAIPFHYNCDDCWYSCPKSPDGCCDDSQPKDKCTCGEDVRVAAVCAQLEELEKILPEKAK